jgi:hypothetical protein
VPETRFWPGYRRAGPSDPLVAAFRSLQEEARQASGMGSGGCSVHAGAYDRYREWLPFHCRRRIFIHRVHAAPGYPEPNGR